MLQHDNMQRKAFSARGPHVVAPKHFQHARASEPRRACADIAGERQTRQHKVLSSSVSAGRQKAELDPDDKDDISPSQKNGTPWPITASVITAKSATVPRKTAARMPNGMAKAAAKSRAEPASSAVAGKRSSTTPVASTPCKKEVPKSPETHPR